jgi:hypothetical protein
VEIEGLALEIRFNELDLIDTRNDDVSRATMAWKRRDKQASAFGGNPLPRGGKQGLHLGVNRPAEFDELSNAGFPNVSH